MVRSAPAWAVLARIADLEGALVCKHTHGELGVAAAASQHAMLTLPNAVRGHQQTAAVNPVFLLGEGAADPVAPQVPAVRAGSVRLVSQDAVRAGAGPAGTVPVPARRSLGCGDCLDGREPTGPHGGYQSRQPGERQHRGRHGDIDPGRNATVTLKTGFSWMRGSTHWFPRAVPASAGSPS